MTTLDSTTVTAPALEARDIVKRFDGVHALNGAQLSVRVASPAGPAAHGPRTVRSRLTDEERAAHAAFLAGLGDKAIWRDYVGEETAG